MIHQLDEREINRVLGQNFSIWSPGLDPTRYLHYQWWQLCHPWGRRNLQYWGLCDGSKGVVASCKLYKFDYKSRNQSFIAAGIGAVFVPEEERGNAYGRRLLEGLAQHCKSLNFDFMILNSDIDPDYYSKLDFHMFQPSVFRVFPDKDWLKQSMKKLDSLTLASVDESFRIRRASLADVDEIARHHARWLVNQPYGFKRSEDYLEYKLGREFYLAQHSRLGWPKMEIIIDNEGRHYGGYALIEQAGSYLRILEVIGSEAVRISLWGQILRLAQKREVHLIRGWSKTAPPLKGLEYYMRDWSFPMIRPLKQESRSKLIGWTAINPPSILELDHF